jgi:hypothetical protein
VRKFLVLAVVMIPLISASFPMRAEAVIGIMDNVPSATLLVPYFEVRMPKKIGGKPAGVTTLFSIINGTDLPTLAKVVVWSELAVPVLGFNVYLSGYDVQAIDLQQVLLGHLPQTGSPDVCKGFLPPPPLDPGTVGHVSALLTGKPSPLTGQCASRDHGDLVARGYVTVDVVNRCTFDVPTDAGYFSGGDRVAANSNALFGEAEIVDRQKKLGIGDLVVHIEAADAFFVNGDRTFYGRYVGNNGSDGREPLSSIFGARYRDIPKDKIFPQGTSLVVWRDTLSSAATQFACGTTPPWFPLNIGEIVAFDEQENAATSPAQPFPAAANRVSTIGPVFPLPFSAGWVYLNLHAGLDTHAQAWVTVFQESKGRNSVTHPAIVFE